MNRSRAFLVAAPIVVLAGVLVGGLVVGNLPAAGAARDRLDWSDVEATVRGPLDPNSSNPCDRGDLACVALVRREMNRRLDGLLARCDHRAAFLFAVASTTRAIETELARGQRFADARYLALFDAVFAKLYFTALSDYDAVRDSQLSPSWGIALQAAADKSNTGIGDMLLGMNAHISRDLPFVVEAMGVTAPDGTSRQADFEAVDQILASLQQPMLERAARRLDPGIATFSIPGLGIDEATFAAVITAWRDEAWRNGERLLSAPTPAARALVAQQIEAVAQLRAEAIKTATLYLPIGPSTRDRDRFCRKHA